MIIGLALKLSLLSLTNHAVKKRNINFIINALLVKWLSRYGQRNYVFTMQQNNIASKWLRAVIVVYFSDTGAGLMWVNIIVMWRYATIYANYALG